VELERKMKNEKRKTTERGGIPGAASTERKTKSEKRKTAERGGLPALPLSLLPFSFGLLPRPFFVSRFSFFVPPGGHA
jgi:hypothetical protein